MEYDGRGRASDGFGPSGRFPLDLPMGDQKAQLAAEYRDPSRALALLRELGPKATKELVVLMPALVSLLKHDSVLVVKQSIVSGTSFFCAVLEEIALQIRHSGTIERWVEEIWSWMLKFKDKICDIMSEPGAVEAKALAVKFLEVYVLLFTSEVNNIERSFTEGYVRNFNIIQLVGSHAILDPTLVTYDTKQCIDFLFNLLRSAGSLPGSLTIVIINCLANIARKRPVHYNCILSALLAFDPDFDTLKGAHAASIRYSLRTAFLGFLRSLHHPLMIESRDKLLWALRTMNPGESIEQIIRQAEKMSKNMERFSRDARSSKEDALSNQLSVSGELVTKTVHSGYDSPMINDEVLAKRARYDTSAHPQLDNDPPLDDSEDSDAENGSSKTCLLDSSLAAVEQMIAMIGAMLAEGERGAESLEILISQIQPELLADIVIVNMKHLPNGSLPLSSNTENASDQSQISSSGTMPAAGLFSADTSTLDSPGTSQLAATSISSAGVSALAPDLSVPNVFLDSKRDPRRDPRRLDPRRLVAPVGSDLAPSNNDSSDMNSGLESTQSQPVTDLTTMKVEMSSVPSNSKNNTEPPDTSPASLSDQLPSQESSISLDKVAEPVPSLDITMSSELPLSPVHAEQDLGELIPLEVTSNEGVDTDMLEPDQCSSAISVTLAYEQTCCDLPEVPVYVELSDEQRKSIENSAIMRITEAYKQIPVTGCVKARFSLLARLVAQTNDADAGEIIAMLQKHINLDYHRYKGHDLAMNILYHLHAIMASESKEQASSFAFVIYEQFLHAVARYLHESLPASDKSFSRLLGEAPVLPESVLKLLEDLCQSPSSDLHGKDTPDGDRVTQGLGTVWSLILIRPSVRQACLNIALKCTIHPQDEVRAKAIRLVANKLYMLDYLAEDIEQFAKVKLLSLVDQHEKDIELAPSGSSEQKANVGNQETSNSGLLNSEPGASESVAMKNAQFAVHSTLSISVSLAQRYSSLFFALCTKKTGLLQVVFDIYGRAPKAVKQSIHRHVPILLRNVGPSYSDLLRIISNPPDESENLLMLVLQILTEEMTPSAELIATVKHLYETKLKDASILIPMLSSLSKDEVLPIFPRLVDLPLEKFQTALARILEGSAYTNPALTPAEVLVAIHDISPEKDGISLKKIMDVCTACFEQRTVFTQQVLAKSLSHLVDRTPLPLLFMRTVIQAIDAFPSLVDFVMEILSKLVSKQIWKMPKLWVGFLKCASQTQPHSFPVLLQLPPQQLEIALNRYANLRAPLSAHAGQPSIRNSLPRSILAVLGLVSEPQQPSHPVLPTALRTSGTSSSSVQGATLT